METQDELKAIDIVIGKNLRKTRMMRGMTQNDLASKIGVTFQQLQKYENAQNRVSASKLAILAESLNTPLESFYPEQYQTTNENPIIRSLTISFR